MGSNKRKKEICWEDPTRSARNPNLITGLDYLLLIKHGKIPQPPVAKLVGYKLTDVGNGFAEFVLSPGEYHYNPFNTVHGGILSTLMDTAMTASVLSTLTKKASCSTVEIKVNFIRPVSVKTKYIRCKATPVHVGKKLATAEAKLVDDKGVIYAHGTSTIAIINN